MQRNKAIKNTKLIKAWNQLALAFFNIFSFLSLKCCSYY
jgi:hypothetical protein